MSSPAPALRLRDEASLNVIIPMGGSDEAFRSAGYSAPKPMIKIAGRPLLLHLLDSLRLRLGDVVWLVIPSAVYLQFQAQLDFKSEYPQADIRICQFTVLTRGAIETIFIGLQHMSSAELMRRTLCLDCDTLYFSDVLSMFRAVKPASGMCAYFVDEGSAALYSYLRLSDDDSIAEVHEKSAVSTLANAGAYGFASGALLRTYVSQLLDSPDGGRHQYFLSTAINKMIGEGHSFCAQHADECVQCGTPEKLEKFMDAVSAGRALTMPKRRFCFALDNVLVTPPDTPGDFTSVRPIDKNVQLVRELHEAGHHIIITTSRLMGEKHGNIGSVLAACGAQTLTTLKEFRIPYDEIHFGQPYAHVYVDASVACSALHTEKDLGWRLVGQREQLEPGMVAARHFNNVTLEGDSVVKTAATAVLRGEIFWYQNMPPDIAHLFPRMLSTSTASPSPRSPCSPAVPHSAHHAPEPAPLPHAHSAHAIVEPPPPPPQPSPPPPPSQQPLPLYTFAQTDTSPVSPLAAMSLGSHGNGSGGSPQTCAAAHLGYMEASVEQRRAAKRESDKAAAAAAAAARVPSRVLQPANGASLEVPVGGPAPSMATPGSGVPEEGVSSLTLQRIKGVTFSHLVTNRSLTPGRLHHLLTALRQVHSSSGDPHTLLPVERAELCANYLPKLRKRYSVHKELYRRLSLEADHMFRIIEGWLTTYETEERWVHANAIHGDPVFSNVLLTDDGRPYLLDMRGELGSTLTLQGDLNYDLSKVYQSLLGYDYIILSQPLHERDAELLEELRHTFRSFVRDHYPEVAIADVIKITASHYFGIVPLHVNKEHQLAYLQTAAALISAVM